MITHFSIFSVAQQSVCVQYIYNTNFLAHFEGKQTDKWAKTKTDKMSHQVSRRARGPLSNARHEILESRTQSISRNTSRFRNGAQKRHWPTQFRKRKIKKYNIRGELKLGADGRNQHTKMQRERRSAVVKQKWSRSKESNVKTHRGRFGQRFTMKQFDFNSSSLVWPRCIILMYVFTTKTRHHFVPGCSSERTTEP